MGARFAEMAESVGLLLRERSLPRRVAVDVKIGGEVRRVRTGTPLRALLPAEVNGAPVVAALLGNKAVALGTPLTSEAPVEPLTTDHWEGKRVYRQSLGMLLLEAAAHADPEGEARLGPSIGFARRVTRTGRAAVDPAAWAEKVARRMHLLVAIDAPFRHELWSVDEARAHFAERGARDAVLFLRGARDGAVPLSSCGSVYALGTGPLLPSTAPIDRFPFRLEPDDRGFLLHYGDEPADAPREMAGPPASTPAPGPARPPRSPPRARPRSSRAAPRTPRTSSGSARSASPASAPSTRRASWAASRRSSGSARACTRSASARSPTPSPRAPAGCAPSPSPAPRPRARPPSSSA